ncbi:hypothetical protein TREMEDRAFT_41844 [Tremella mesenterica DSM 1558]|uniref:uncharacterized protein n=1 Tax=Tremella mesenterica (strain ATCC 24925 / CBS 8224 / DSM 1558 / NBRC 9311 / NRRL Y-6157 / RJB 2259-6 / UBC 559-6) TaxID=578456 RepID=UPI0003F49220|nr:uncharacterized protein TREMEDRAFT_41844 [Tremella mesenterica DSM 1558]EIW72591.1 hypothetical protein TREMEDRAFT_41844 [Tremella mesenterica DSM 1558]
MSADHTLYHVQPTGFWKKFRDAVVVNPEISSGLPIPELNRYPQPGSRPERYATPATKASDPAFNPYYKRDSRRAYPQTSVITQNHIATLLISSESLQALPSPQTKVETTPENASAIAPSSEQPTTAVAATPVPSLSEVLTKLPKAYVGAGLQTGAGEGLPPVPPPNTAGKWIPKAGGEIPHDPHAYFPMIGYS